MDRVRTGVIGLDGLLEGGFPSGRSVLVSGGCGTGKTTFGVQYIYSGAENYGEPGIYVALDERPKIIREDSLNFGWDLRRLEEENMLQILDGAIARIGVPSDEEFALPSTGFDVEKLLIEILTSIKRYGAKRVVIDSIPSLGYNLKTEHDIRKAILKLGYMLDKAGATSVLISEIGEGKNKFSKYGVEEYLVDGVIVLHYMGVGMTSNRTLHIRKMRGTKHSEDLHPLEIGDRGLVVHKIEEEYEGV